MCTFPFREGIIDGNSDSRSVIFFFVFRKVVRESLALVGKVENKGTSVSTSTPLGGL